jgi:quinol monooxygenase YgiN
MFVYLVFIHVNENDIEAFIQASEENAAASRQEPGIVRFDLIQQEDDPTRFILIEIYRDEAAPGLHKETGHYLKWRETVTSMMAEPRKGVRYRILSPEEAAWG